MKVFENAKWIGFGRKDCKFATDYMSPALQLRKTFTLQSDVKNAICRICGLGIYVLYINGKRVGDDVLSPAYTIYDKRDLYVEYDVSSYLQKGDNVVAVKLGDGFYNQTTRDSWGFYFATWRDFVKLLFELLIEDKVMLESDDTWRCTMDGATVHNAIRTGEHYDARKENDWTQVVFDDFLWQNAKVVAPAGGKLTKSTLPPIRECEVLDAVSMHKSQNGWVFDFGKNMSGYAGIKMSGKRGQTISLRYAERFNGSEIDQADMQMDYTGTIPFATDKYTFNGYGVEQWKPDFVYHGFRYVEVVGLENEPPMDALKAYFVHTDLAKKGDFSTSDELLNWIYQAGRQSLLSNYHGFPEDCPQREKNGWTGDAEFSCEYATYLFDMKEAYKKWLQDICDAQRESGQLPGIVPTCAWGYNWGSGPAWDCALLFLPYVLYKETGDTECFDVVYAAAEKYMQYAKYRSKNGLVCYGLYDWAPPYDVDNLKRMDNCLSDSCYYYKMQLIMSEMASLRGETDKAKAYAQDAEKTRVAILDKFVDDDNVDNNCSASLAEVLYFNVVQGEQAKRIAKHLTKVVEADKYMFKVGVLGMKALLNALSAYGYTDVAYKMVNRYDYTSFGYWKNLGATTFCENWNMSRSLNHHMYGDVVNWMARNIAGLQNVGIAYDKVLLKPYFFAENCDAATQTQTPHGNIAFAWKKQGNTFVADVEIPQGVCAELCIDGKENVGLDGAGMRRIEILL